MTTKEKGRTMSDTPKQITAKAIRDRAAEHGYAMAMDTASDLAAMVLAAQREAGYAIVSVSEIDRLHYEADGFCSEDGFVWPCATAQLLAAAEAAEGAQR